jgi:hypothetical protein
MNPEQEQQELTQYLKDTLAQLKSLESRVAHRSKTKKYKAIASLLMIVWCRVNSTLQYVRAGGHSDFSVIIQRQMYDPIIKWLGVEIG